MFKDSQTWTAAEYAYWKAFCETCEWYKENGGTLHPNYKPAKSSVDRYEAFKERARKLFTRQARYEPELPNIEIGDVPPKMVR